MGYAIITACRPTKFRPRRAVRTVIALALCAAAAPLAAQEGAPPIIEKMLREALEDERQTVENILKRLYPERIAEIDALIDRIEDEEKAQVAQSTILEGWSGEGAIGADLSSGNVDQWGVSGSLAVKRKGLDWEHNLALKLDYGEIEGERTDERISATYSGHYDIGKSTFLFGSLRYERDRLQDIDRRFTEAVGLGYELIDTDAIEWTVQAGPALRQTRFRTQADENRLGLLGSTRFAWDISDTLELRQTLALIIDEGNSTFNSETALTAMLYGRLSARMSVEVEHESDPPPGAETTDVFIKGSLVYGF